MDNVRGSPAEGYVLTSIEREAYFSCGIFYERPHTCSGQNTNKKNVLL